MRLRDRKLLLAPVAIASLIVAGTLALVRNEDPPRVKIEAGVLTPALAGSAVRGGEVSLERLRGRVVLVSFLNSRAEATIEGDPSRAQIVFLRSMQTQHERFGLRVIVVDAADLARELSVPDDLSVVGYDDIPVAGFVDPPLTTVRQPMREVGALAAKVLLDRISGDGATPVGGRIHLPTTVIERGSVGPPRHDR
jgi:Periplasmic binding protein-like domain